MRKSLVVVGLLLVVLFVTNAAAEGYRVILKNGSYVQAREKPVAEGGNARILLFRGGVAVVPANSIDWEATERWHKKADAAEPVAEGAKPAPKTVPSGTITMVGDAPHGGSQDSGSQAPAPDPARPAPVAGSDPGSDSRKRQRYQELELQVERLRAQKAELERRAHGMPSLDGATDLRGQAADLETRIQAIVAEQNTLLAEGNAATKNTGDDPEVARRLRFLNTEIPKLRTEKAQLEQQAHESVSLDDAKVLRDKADALFTRIQALEKERDGLAARRSQ